MLIVAIVIVGYLLVAFMTAVILNAVWTDEATDDERIYSSTGLSLIWPLVLLFVAVLAVFTALSSMTDAVARRIRSRR